MCVCVLTEISEGQLVVVCACVCVLTEVSEGH